jgi:hypothetical protein
MASRRGLIGGGGGAPYSSGGSTINVVPKGDGAGKLTDSSITDTGSVISSAEPIRLGNGTLAAPSYSFTGQTGTGLRYNSGLEAVYSGNTAFLATHVSHIWSSGVIAGWASGDADSTGQDTFFLRRGAANFQLGAADAAAPVAQTLTCQAATATNTDQAGGTWTLQNSLGTGIGVLPKMILKGALLGATGTTVQTSAIREVLEYTKTGLTNNSATALVQLALASGSHATAQFAYSVEVNDATDFQTETGMVSFASVNKAGALTHGTPAKSGNVQALSSGATLAVTFTAVTNGSAVDLKITSNSSLTPTSTRVMLQLINLSFKNDATLQ